MEVKRKLLDIVRDKKLSYKFVDITMIYTHVVAEINKSKVVSPFRILIIFVPKMGYKY
jgi:hypothetical protein